MRARLLQYAVWRARHRRRNSLARPEQSRRRPQELRRRQRQGVTSNSTCTFVPNTPGPAEGGAGSPGGEEEMEATAGGAGVTLRSGSSVGEATAAAAAAAACDGTGTYTTRLNWSWVALPVLPVCRTACGRTRILQVLSYLHSFMRSCWSFLKCVCSGHTAAPATFLVRVAILAVLPPGKKPSRASCGPRRSYTHTQPLTHLPKVCILSRKFTKNKTLQRITRTSLRLSRHYQ